MPAFRVMVNTAAPQGSVGITTNLQPSMTLGCGAVGGNSTSDNVGPQHLVNIKRLAWAVRLPEEALQIPEIKTAARPAAPAPAMAAAPASVDRQTVAAAVERYLAQKGLAGTAAKASGDVAGVVDRFLEARRAAGSSVPSPACDVCAHSAPADTAAASAKPAAAPEPQIAIVDFVCEADVRDAARQGKKIYIGPKTIVTPAAREAAAASDVLVMAQR
jgi:acetaldehyde dehydrogenase (acetylating)